MSERLYEYIEIKNLKEMLNKTRNIYAKKTAYKIRTQDNRYKTITHGEVIKKIKYSGKNKLKHLIAMDICEHSEGIYSQEELIKKGKMLLEEGNREFIDSKINSEEMSIMLFTSGTTSASKVVCLSHNNICSNLMDLASTLDINSKDTLLSVLPVHHVFECTVGFLFGLYKGAETVFCDGIRHIVKNLKEYNVSVMACVPSLYEGIFNIIRRQLEKEGKLQEILEKEEKYRNNSMEEKREIFKEIHDKLKIRMKKVSENL